jgi:hypothetical protein
MWRLVVTSPKAVLDVVVAMSVKAMKEHMAVEIWEDRGDKVMHHGF